MPNSDEQVSVEEKASAEAEIERVRRHVEAIRERIRAMNQALAEAA